MNARRPARGRSGGRPPRNAREYHIGMMRGPLLGLSVETKRIGEWGTGGAEQMAAGSMASTRERVVELAP
jgi:hypothetical protein